MLVNSNTHTYMELAHVAHTNCPANVNDNMCACICYMREYMLISIHQCLWNTNQARERKCRSPAPFVSPKCHEINADKSCASVEGLRQCTCAFIFTLAIILGTKRLVSFNCVGFVSSSHSWQSQLKQLLTSLQ